MPSKLGRRLEALEQRAQPAKGIRTFYQSADDAGVFFEGDDGPAYTAAQLHELSAQGWTVLKVVYKAMGAVNPMA